MRRLELLINQARRATESTEFSSETGIQDSEFIEYMNNAQDRCFSRIMSVHPNIDMLEKEIPAVAGQESYTIPVDAYLRTKLEFVEFSSTGSTKDYFPLNKGRLRERFNGDPGSPSFYVRRGSNILVQPSPAVGTGKLRLNYYQKLPTLDVRRGQVIAVDLGANFINSLTLDTTILLTNEGADTIQELGYISVVDKDGNIKMKSIPVTSLNINTGVFALGAGFNFEAGETIAVGDYVVSGIYATTHSMLDDSCERYLIAHCEWKILKRDSSSDSMEADKELTAILVEVTDTYKDVDEDLDFVPIIDDTYLTY